MARLRPPPASDAAGAEAEAEAAASVLAPTAYGSAASATLGLETSQIRGKGLENNGQMGMWVGVDVTCHNCEPLGGS